MAMLFFEWDPVKAAANLSKHKVSFEDAPLSIGTSMRKQYDFSTATKNPYAAQLKKPVTIRLDESSIIYFKSMAEETGIAYQSLINLYLKECAASGKKLKLAWK
jgi:predicted DNA binding CopG/RHH family protein